MKIIKLTTPWPHDYISKTPSGSGIFNDFKFEINNDCLECDFWVVWGGLENKTRVKCPPENIIYITDEAHTERVFNDNFLNQFPTVFSCRNDINHSNVIKTHDLGIYYFNAPYNEIKKMVPVEKTKNLSVIASDLTWLEGHKKRFAFVNKLMGHYKDNIDYYGRGINPIEDKIDALLPYNYSIAIENSFIPNYFTEKVFECFLTYTLPIYYGCPNLERYFDERAFIRIDIDNFSESTNIIDNVISKNLYKERLPYIVDARKLFLEEYYFFPAVINKIKNYFSLNTTKKKYNTLMPENYYQVSTIRRIYNSIRSLN